MLSNHSAVKTAKHQTPHGYAVRTQCATQYHSVSVLVRNPCDVSDTQFCLFHEIFPEKNALFSFFPSLLFSLHQTISHTHTRTHAYTYTHTLSLFFSRPLGQSAAVCSHSLSNTQLAENHFFLAIGEMIFR